MEESDLFKNIETNFKSKKFYEINDFNEFNLLIKHNQFVYASELLDSRVFINGELGTYLGISIIFPKMKDIIIQSPVKQFDDEIEYLDIRKDPYFLLISDYPEEVQKIPNEIGFLTNSLIRVIEKT